MNFVKYTIFLLLILIFPASTFAQTCYPQRNYNNYNNGYNYVNQYNVTVLAVPVNQLYFPYYYQLDKEWVKENIFNDIKQEVEKPTGKKPNFSLFDIKEDAAIVFKSNCMSCHKVGKDKPGIKLFNNDSTLYLNPDSNLEVKRREKILDAVYSNSMPKNGKALSEQDKNVLKLFLREVQ